MCPGIYPNMIGMPQTQEFLIGYSPDGNYEIIARPGKFFFLEKNFFFQFFLVLYEMLIGLMYRVFFFVFVFFFKSHLLLLFLF